MLQLDNTGGAGSSWAQLRVDGLHNSRAIVNVIANLEHERWTSRGVVLNRDQLMELRAAIGYYLRNSSHVPENTPRPYRGEI